MTETFHYLGGNLFAEDVALEKIATEVGTPCYVYSRKRLQENYAAFAAAVAVPNVKTGIYYAIKSNANVAVAATLVECGAGVDVTSGGELERALAAGTEPRNIIYSGVGKMRDEIATALKVGVRQLNVESIPELHAIAAVAAEMNVVAPVALRVNPDVVARTYKKTSTGELSTKFGIPFSQLDEAMHLTGTSPALRFSGFQVHIGSHVYDYEPFRDAFQQVAKLVREWRARGVVVDHLDLGGGVSIPYDDHGLPPLSDYGAIVRETLGDIGCELSFEPGRRLVGDAGVLLSRVIYDKPSVGKHFLIIDAGMNDLVRPAMYGARHGIKPLKENTGDAGLVDVVGPICETADLFGEDYRLLGIEAGSLMAIMQAGAYSSAMASTYNGRALVPEVMVSGSSTRIVRRRITVQEQIGWEAKS